MKIAVDARNLVPRLTGIGRYVLEISQRLAASDHDLKLYLPDQPSTDLRGLTGAQIEIGKFPGAAARTLWGQTVLPRLARRDGVDVFWGPAHRLPVGLSKSIPRVLTIHDLVWIKAAATMQARTLMGERLFLVSSLMQADIIVTVSDSTAADIRARFPKLMAPIVTVYPGANSLPPAGNERLADHDGVLAKHKIDKPFALFVGTLEPRKNLIALLKAYASLDAKTQSKCLLVIAGGKGWGGQDLETEVAAAGIGQHVRMLGYVNELELAALYARCLFLTMPSVYEGFGLPIVEANAFGAPALTANLSSMPEIGGEAALLVDPHSIQSIADGFRRMVNDDALRATLAAHARPNAARFDWTRCAAQLVDVFRQAQRLREKKLS